MGGTPSDKTKSQRYANNKKGRTSSFFLYRPKASTTPTKGLHQFQSVVHDNSIMNDTFGNSSLPTLKLLEMEVITPTDSESDDFHPSSSISSIEGGGGHRTTVEPHIATKVQFSTVEIRAYTITIGDHPCCTIGCPITLDWDYLSDDTISIDDYEQQKYQQTHTSSQQQQHHHHRNDLRISPQDRMELLLFHASMNKSNNTNSLSEMEIRRASRKFHRTKHCSVRHNIRIHETFFHCPIDIDGHEDDEYEDDDTNSTDTNSTDDEDDERDQHEDDDVVVDVMATNMKMTHQKTGSLVCIHQLHEV
jgi:hypothetical protein